MYVCVFVCVFVCMYVCGCGCVYLYNVIHYIYNNTSDNMFTLYLFI